MTNNDELADRGRLKQAEPRRIGDLVISPGECRIGASRKFDQETRERAVRMYLDRLAERSDFKLAGRKYVGEVLDMKPATLRGWIEKNIGRDSGLES